MWVPGHGLNNGNHLGEGGELNTKPLATIARMLGTNPRASDLQYTLGQVDPDGEGIDYPEFLLTMARHAPAWPVAVSESLALPISVKGMENPATRSRFKKAVAGAAEVTPDKVSIVRVRPAPGGAGSIVEVTPAAAAAGFSVGQTVAYSVLGTYCEYTAVPTAKLLPVPDGVDLGVATAIMTQGLTAHYLTTSAHANLIKPGEWMLIHGVGGGTCQWAAQMARLKGYKTIGTVSKGKEDIGLSTKCDELIVLDEVPGQSFEDYESKDVVGKVMEVTGGEGCKAVIDGIGKSTVDISIGSLARRGIFVSFGNASGAVPAFPVLRLIKKSAFVTRPKLLDYVSTRMSSRSKSHV